MKAGDIIEILADCTTFENGVKDWRQRSKKMFMRARRSGGKKSPDSVLIV